MEFDDASHSETSTSRHRACPLLAVLAGAVEASVQEADPFLQVVSLKSHHPVSHHHLLSN